MLEFTSRGKKEGYSCIWTQDTFHLCLYIVEHVPTITWGFLIWQTWEAYLKAFHWEDRQWQFSIPKGQAVYHYKSFPTTYRHPRMLGCVNILGSQKPNSNIMNTARALEHVTASRATGKSPTGMVHRLLSSWSKNSLIVGSLKILALFYYHVSLEARQNSLWKGCRAVILKSRKSSFQQLYSATNNCFSVLLQTLILQSWLV